MASTILVAALPTTESHAQGSNEEASPAKPFSIPAETLSDALIAFGRQAGVQATVDTNIAKGIRTNAVRGTMTWPQALQKLLGGTGLSYRLNGRMIAVGKASATITLGPVRVGGTLAHQNPTGPGVGYVATTTMAGTKTDTAVTEVPGSVYVVTKQQMIDQQPQNVMEALRYSAGVYAERLGTYSNGSPGSGYSNILQRGFATSQFVDGLMTTTYSAGETAFLERIEAVNGPASVMYGQTNPGGLIAITLKKPTDKPLHSVSVGFGSWNRYEATLDYSDKINKSGTLRYRMAAIGTTQDTQTDAIAYKRVGVLPSITWDIDPKTSLTLLGSYLYTPGNGVDYLSYPPEGTLYRSPYGRISRSEFYGSRDFNRNGNRDAMFEYQFHHRFNKFVNFDQVFRWEQSDNHLEETALQQMYTKRIAVLQPQISKYKDTTASMDARFDGKFSLGGVHNTWVVGSDFRKFKYSWDYLQDVTPGYNGYPGKWGYVLVDIFSPHNTYTPCINIHSQECRVYDYIIHTDSFQEGVYFQDQIKWKGLSILLGGRQDWVNTNTNTATYSNINAAHQVISSNTTNPSRPEQKFTWRAGILYNFEFGLTPYFSYSTSFIPQTGNDWRGTPFPSLTGDQKEVGLKYKIPNREVLITASAYDINENHYLITDAQHAGFSADAGRINGRGFEVAANANVTRDLRLIAAYSYNSVTYADTNLSARTQLPDGSYGPSASEKGKYVQGVPRDMFSTFLNYDLPKGTVPGLSVNGGVRWVGFTYNDAVNTFKVPAYHLFDIGMSYDFGAAVPFLKGMRAQLSVSNLANTYYITSAAETLAAFWGRDAAYMVI